jgi:hypothetical protein
MKRCRMRSIWYVTVKTGSAASMRTSDGRDVWLPAVLKKLAIMPEFKLEARLSYEKQRIEAYDVLELPGKLNAKALPVESRQIILRQLERGYGLGVKKTRW